MFELKDRDANGRICKWTIGEYTIRTPNICIVINPGKMIVTPKELKDKFGAEIIITNSFIINKNHDIREKVLEQGIHKFLDWNGPVYTDSGTFQQFSQGIKNIEQREIIEFQEKIGSDIITPVDIFTVPDDTKAVAEQKLIETNKQILQAKNTLTKGKFLVGPIQGGSFLDLRKKACKQLTAIGPDIFALGGIVPLMEQYQFKELFDIMLTCKENLPANKIFHNFGAGHPMIFAPLVALGCDLFDSAMYAISAADDRYLTVNGTHQLADLFEFPCACPECVKTNPDEVKKLPKYERELFLSRHNLYVTFAEMRTIRQAIRENNLWELVQTRLRAHPNLLEAFEVISKHEKYLIKQDSISKKSAFFYSGKESELRPEVIRAKQMMKKVKGKTFVKRPFGKVPAGLKGVYPFGQSIIPGNTEKNIKVDPKDIIKQTIQYQFGSKIKTDFKPEVSRKTGRIRRVWKDKTLLGTIRSHDGFFIPSMEGAKYVKMKKVLVDDEDVAKHVREGKSLFAKFVSGCDDIIPGEEVAVVYKKQIIAIGTAILNSKEMREFGRGVAVNIR